MVQIVTAVWIVALDTRESKALLHAAKVYVGMCRNHTVASRSAGTAVACKAEFIDLCRGKKKRATNSRMRPVTGGTGIGERCIVVVRVSLRKRDPRQAKAQEQNNYKNR
jgi:hypothetical protein